jgi:hypothetical protein
MQRAAQALEWATRCPGSCPTDRRTIKQMHGWTDGPTGRMDGRMDRQTDNRRTNGQAWTVEPAFQSASEELPQPMACAAHAAVQHHPPGADPVAGRAGGVAVGAGACSDLKGHHLHARPKGEAGTGAVLALQEPSVGSA